MANVIKSTEVAKINELPKLTEKQGNHVFVDDVRIVPFGICIVYAIGTADCEDMVVDREEYETWLRDNHKLDCEFLGKYEDVDAYWENQDYSTQLLDAKSFIQNVCVVRLPLTALDTLTNLKTA